MSEEVFNSFKFIKQIGKGASSRVYEIRDKDNHGYALKEIGICDEESIDLINNEKSMPVVLHDNILSYNCLFVSTRPNCIYKIIGENSKESRPSSTIDYSALSSEKGNIVKSVYKRMNSPKIHPNHFNLSLYGNGKRNADNKLCFQKQGLNKKETSLYEEKISRESNEYDLRPSSLIERRKNNMIYVNSKKRYIIIERPEYNFCLPDKRNKFIKPIIYLSNQNQNLEEERRLTKKKKTEVDSRSKRIDFFQFVKLNIKSKISYIKLKFKNHCLNIKKNKNGGFIIERNIEDYKLEKYNYQQPMKTRKYFIEVYRCLRHYNLQSMCLNFKNINIIRKKFSFLDRINIKQRGNSLLFTEYKEKERFDSLITLNNLRRSSSFNYASITKSEFDSLVPMKKHQKLKDRGNLLKNKQYFYLITELCDFSLREYIDKRNELMCNHGSIQKFIESEQKRRNNIGNRDYDKPGNKIVDVEDIGLKISDLNNFESKRCKGYNLKMGNKIKCPFYDICDKEITTPIIIQEKDEVKGNFKDSYSLHTIKIKDQFGLVKSIPLQFFKETEKREKNTLYFKIWRCIVEGISYLHSKGIYHNDLSCSNIFFNSCFIPKIGDFGMNSNEDYSKIKRNNGNECNKSKAKKDLKNLGLILFEMLWPMKTSMERAKTMENVLNNLVFPAKFREQNLKEMKIIMLCLNSNRNFLRADELLKICEDYLGEAKIV